jgi:hypothetical protein
MAPTGHKVALAEAVAEARKQELQHFAELDTQLELFEAGPARVSAGDETGSSGSSTTVTRIGRPPGARNKRTDKAACFYMVIHGYPLERGVTISSMPVLAPGVLGILSQELGMSRAEAARWWLGVYSATLPFIHQRLATLTVKPPGSPEGEPVSWTFSGTGELVESSEFVDVTPNPATHESEIEGG